MISTKPMRKRLKRNSLIISLSLTTSSLGLHALIAYGRHNIGIDLLSMPMVELMTLARSGLGDHYCDGGGHRRTINSKIKWGMAGISLELSSILCPPPNVS